MKLSSNKTAPKRLHLYYSGSVQGIGFRYTAERLANSMNLKGWAKNTSDGRVEIVCDGKESDIDMFLEKINSIFKDYISDIDMEPDLSREKFYGFDIRF